MRKTIVAAFALLGMVAMGYSKHNLLEEGYAMSYENGRVVSKIKNDGFFTYSDGTVHRNSKYAKLTVIF